MREHASRHRTSSSTALGAFPLPWLMLLLSLRPSSAAFSTVPVQPTVIRGQQASKADDTLCEPTDSQLLQKSEDEIKTTAPGNVAAQEHAARSAKNSRRQKGSSASAGRISSIAVGAIGGLALLHAVPRTAVMLGL
mmetsp:Transcript_12682/g.28027  ORF Transcript_12682/g.28027 Transcript_12682/m.28027 type:complete len:136 (-) Transcript_12682:119-526(-)|eukprot:CAMPEP_0170602398 /NCGR_PEP_ID=MMETSP0224-20130122/18368_1 /TAXON_ID=285029 /ORGANISM="Togula jolla, Strain CCCM 725" /LENGTH=135 /DNA_ID=CAMNT_0010927231 /DNA_START=85 /DNA_END=492 /DNA_ORIENTATION=-